jgi:hypothetical protein
MDNSESNKNNQRSRPDRADGSVDDEVQRLFRRGNGSISDKEFNKLRQKFDDVELVDKIQKAFIEKHSHITKKAKKFAQLIREKYANRQYPFHVLLEKARLFKTKHGLSDDEFAEFQRIYEQELVGLGSPDVYQPATNMMKVLGSVNIDFQGFSTKLNDTDYKYLQELLKLHAASRPLHAQVVLQSMQYNDCDFEAITGEFDKKVGNRPGDHVHPVIAAMFFPKIEALENTFLHSNIAGIVKSRYNGEALVTKPDYELFYALTNDPNDIVCDNKSSMLDLLNRAQVQHQLWNNVLSLRNGQYYNTNFRDFISSVDMCKLNKHDNPDLVYGRYDGTVLKRLLSAFSFRPTIVSTTPVYSMVNTNPYQQNVRPMVSAISMINLRLPPSINDSDSVSLEDSINQQQFFIENGVMVPRHTSLIYSRNVLFFYVDRRTNLLRFNDMQPFNLAALPVSVSGFERINTRNVNFQPRFNVRDDVYELRSVVLSEVNRLTPEANTVVGSSAIFRIPGDIQTGRSPAFFQYDPNGVVNQDLNTGSNAKPTFTIEETRTLTSGDNNFEEIAQKRGIVFMYSLVNDASQGNVSW